MRISGRLLAGLTAWLLMMGIVPMGTAPGSQEDNSRVPTSSGDWGSLRLPLTGFTANVGQVANEDVRYYMPGGNVQVGFVESGVLVKAMEPPSSAGDSGVERRFAVESRKAEVPRGGVLVRISFEGSNAVMPEGRDEVGHRSNFFIGNDPYRWRTNVRSFREIIYPNLYDGIDLVYLAGGGIYMGEASGGIAKYEFRVRPGADLTEIRARYGGMVSLSVDLAGNLVAHTGMGDITDSRPVAYQGDGRRVDCRFILLPSDTMGFDCQEFDPYQALVIDPTLYYSTYLGGTGNDYGYAFALDGEGNAYVAGWTKSSDFNVTSGAYDRGLNGSSDAFVTKLNANGSALVYSTFLGGGSEDVGRGIAVDGSGKAYIVGHTTSTNFPTTTGAPQRGLNGSRDAFITKLNANGSALVYSTYLGGDNLDWGFSIAVGLDNKAYVTGETKSGDFPYTLGAFDGVFNGTSDAYVTKFNAAGTGWDYSTYLGGTSWDSGDAIRVNESGNAYVVGSTGSTNFPTTPGAYDRIRNGSSDAFVTKLNAGGSALVYSTFLGGNDDEYGGGVAVGGGDTACVTGHTYSTDFPVTPGAVQPAKGNYSDAFVTKFNGNGSSLVGSTYLGGRGFDKGYDVAVSPSDGGCVATGETSSTDFPTTSNGYDRQLNLGYGTAFDAFLTKVYANATAWNYSTYLGGEHDDIGWGVAHSKVGSPVRGYVTGQTASDLYPTTSRAFQKVWMGGSTPDWTDAFVTSDCMGLNCTTP